MSCKSLLARMYLACSRWKLIRTRIPEKIILIGAPHSSNWDGVMNVVAFWREGRNMKFLVKNSLMKIPVLGSIVKAAGGLAVDRKHPRGMVGSIVDAAKNQETFTLAIAPEATRKPVKYWRSGFYRMGLETHLPIVLGFIDSSTKTFGWSGHMYLSGDVVADMDVIRRHFEGKVGMRSKKIANPILRAEEDEVARERLLQGIDLEEARAYAIEMNKSTGGLGVTE